jgi:hypothetical protein
MQSYVASQREKPLNVTSLTSVGTKAEVLRP